MMPASPRFDFDTLDRLLDAHQHWWRPAPFRDRHLPWTTQLPGLTSALISLSDEDYQHLRLNDQAARQFLSRWIPDILALDQFPDPPAPPLPEGFREPAHVPGRKAGQVACFSALLPAGPQRLVEWCAGQGWLLQAALERFPQRQGLGLEWQARLCQQGEQRIRAARLSATLQPCDVMDPDQVPTLGSTDTVLALHACGHLHQQLVRLAPGMGVHSIHLSPCCYHLGSPDPLSQQGARARLKAGLLDRHLAVQDITTGHSNRSKRNEKASQWRLGYDALRQALTGEDGYRPLKSMPGRIWQGSFEAFAMEAAAHHGLALPASVDWQHWLAEGARAHGRIRRLELVRRQYRRLLEWWLAMDTAAALEERGYRVQLGLFCEGALTPRNLLIQAMRDKP